MLQPLAAEYVRKNNLRARTIELNCRRWDRLIGCDPSPDSLIEFRSRCVDGGLSAVTIEKTITDVLTIWQNCGHSLDAGKRLRQLRPEPRPVPLESIDAIWTEAPHWLRRWLVLTYWTAARCEDSVRLYRLVTTRCDVIRMRAEKTGANHCWPVPEWLQDWLILPASHPLRGTTQHFTDMIRDGLTVLCEKAGVDRFTPQQLRQRSITEWTRANATAGAIVHGSGLGVMAHYLDPLSVLESAAPRVRLPSCFGACVDDETEGTLLIHFRRLDPAAQHLIAGTAERLATG